MDSSEFIPPPDDTSVVVCVVAGDGLFVVDLFIVVFDLAGAGAYVTSPFVTVVTVVIADDLPVSRLDEEITPFAAGGLIESSKASFAGDGWASVSVPNAGV